ncbi:IS4 family transposase [Verminephrobacter aporrectodeae subsp. tuberculatae]|uniref:IS4 family transposase n=1 Tax=Verminephrobacter aporrectodeae subsp. tuberculatae TaxID=1110392 RepID=A0ABT3KYH4_9BURK|nr:IS4 family transposase [Verminephrobacter aporrectodeae]MCW5222069.1 IS4 family transposase [Verminephrobacter aporrectodeae subsp. tuberculatae]MCW5223196.1 IS4 family transposase [Verminephrobacter aporrectodeae subsp. tuberculatae]MCW5256074.1 IS4 family transposase [Verminephrobacter aporrectodeae subsp. tuberculatae]MCW5256521.1 IS4 family transposase [Verminephrobacter aporrectodeae subsp. tuberculatae]MCW5288660.1 IS4 family transposase [Verminephrobacter aporrectodeae subsp. tubercu
MNWVATEFKSMNLGDPRRKQRAIHLIESLSAKPTASIPQACGDWADTIGAYRFFGNEEVQWEDILAPHIENSVARMAAHEHVLCIQDTTELNFNGQKAKGLGPLSYEAQRGMYLHPTYAISTSREPLGVLDAWMWARQPRQSDGSRPGVSESLRWIEGYERLAEMAPQLPNTRLVYVADREADIMALMVRARDLGEPVDWLLRSKHNRVLGEDDKLWSRVTAGDSQGEIRFTLASRQGSRPREVVQQVWAQALELPDGHGGFVQATCIVAREEPLANGEKPIEWRLLTNLPVETLEQAARMIDWYRARWEIEMFFHVLKNGCRIEALQLGSVSKIERAVVLYMVVAWRIARLMRLGRSCPQLDAQLMFEPDEWKAAYILNKQELPKEPPTLNEVVRLIARLGGFLARKRDGEPGVKTIWLGMQRILDFAAGIRFCRELQAQGSCV